MYRKFRLENGKGTIYNLTDQNFKVYGNKPQGLGYTRTMSTLRLGDSELQLYQMFNLDDISFEMLFYDDKLSDKYQKYEEFIRFLSYKPLYIQYQRPNSFDWYRRRVESMSLSKSEVEYKDRMLHCPFTLHCMTFWEDNEINEKIVDNATTDGKIYPITYPFKYSGASLSNIKMISKGMLETPIEIIIDGTVTDPQYILYDDNENIYGRGKFIGTFDKVYVNSEDTQEEVGLTYNDLLLPNPLSYQDLTIGSPNEIFITFLKLKAGTNYLRFIVDNAFDGTVKVRWRNRYVSI